ncbi:MAG: accessory factor UbiK family protein [Alphaproteobacteria bacterium]|nr:accessory factor UbiK family protein [Alphaproteobacteria bacterium]
MQTKSKLFDDMARVASGAAGALSGVRHEVEGIVKQRLERVLADMDLVTRDEFEAVREVAAKARLEQEALEKRVATLEAELSQAATPKAAAPRKAEAKSRAKKAAAKKTAAKKTTAQKPADPPANDPAAD